MGMILIFKIKIRSLKQSDLEDQMFCVILILNLKIKISFIFREQNVRNIELPLIWNTNSQLFWLTFLNVA